MDGEEPGPSRPSPVRFRSRDENTLHQDARSRQRLRVRRRLRPADRRPAGSSARREPAPQGHRLGRPHPHPAVVRGRGAHGDVQRRRQPGRDVRQRHPLCRQLRLGARPGARESAARRDRRRRQDAGARGLERRGSQRQRGHGRADPRTRPHPGALRRADRDRRASRGGRRGSSRHLCFHGKPALRAVLLRSLRARPRDDRTAIRASLALPSAYQHGVRPGPVAARGEDASLGARLGRDGGMRHRRVRVHLLGGDHDIEWRDDGHVTMRGEAVEVFTGEIELPE